jgi:hypothetical protein
LKERKEGEKENQQDQHYAKRGKTLNKCPFRAAKTHQKTEKKWFFSLFLMSFEALDWCRKKVGRLTDKGRLGG